LLEEKFLALGDRLVENDGAAVRALLGEIATLLDAHVALEDERLYPPLERKAEAAGEKSTLILARSFQGGMAVITGALDRLVARQRMASTFNADDFAHEWNTVLHALRSRIHAEEASLYPIYRRLVR